MIHAQEKPGVVNHILTFQTQLSLCSMDVALVRGPPLCRLLRPLGGTAGRTLNTGTFVDTNKSKERKESDTSLAYVSHLVFWDYS